MSCPFCQQIIKDWVLFIIVGVITGIDAFILLMGTSVPQIRFNSTLNMDQEHPTDVSVEKTERGGGGREGEERGRKGGRERKERGKEG